MNGKKRGGNADVMRFVFIGLAVVLVIFLVFIMVNVYRSSVRDDVNIVIMDESEEMTQSIMESESSKESESESDIDETETESESAENEKETETAKEDETKKESESEKESETEKKSAAASSASSGRSSTVAGASTDTSGDENAAADAEASEEDNVVIVSDQGSDVNDDENYENYENYDNQYEASTGNYVSLSSTCYFRSEPGYEDANGNDTIMWELPGGTVVEVLYDNGGWAEVQVDGVVGYVGSKFLAY